MEQIPGQLPSKQLDTRRSAGALPLYRQLASTLRGECERGRYAENEPLPPERDLAATFNVSRNTVRNAIRLLEEQGVLYSDHGRGTFVAPESVRQMSRFLDSFTDDAEKRGRVAGQRILTLEPVLASLALARLLHTEPDTELTHLHRVRLLDGEPVGLQESWLRLPPGARLERRVLEARGSLYRLLIDDFDLRPSECLESLSAVSAEPGESLLLNVAVTSPLLACERITLSDRRQPMEYCVMRYVPSFRYTTRISKWSLA